MDVLRGVLAQAVSQNQELVRAAEAQLAQLETQPGYYTALMGVYRDTGCPKDVRWLATICMKNVSAAKLGHTVITVALYAVIPRSYTNSPV